MKSLLISVVAASALLASAQASAWGDREQGILIGVISGFALNEYRNQQQNQPMTYPNSGASGQFPAFRCQGSEVDCAYQRGVWERKREEWEQMKSDAYQCGRYGRNCNR